VPQRVDGDKLRGRPERFAEHYAQARLFWKSQTPVERMHIERAFRFELTRVQVPAVRERVVAMLANVATELAERLALDLGLAVPEPLPGSVAAEPRPEVEVSPALSLLSRPGDGGIRTRRVAILVCDGVDGDALAALVSRLDDEGAVTRIVGLRLGKIASLRGDEFAVDATAETTPAVLYDALAIPGGKDAAQEMAQWGHALEFVKEQYRHCKPILALGDAREMLDKAGVSLELPTGGPDRGLVVRGDDAVAAAIDEFVKAIAAHRHFARQADPSPV
jgi:catalase